MSTLRCPVFPVEVEELYRVGGRTRCLICRFPRFPRARPAVSPKDVVSWRGRVRCAHVNEALSMVGREQVGAREFFNIPPAYVARWPGDMLGTSLLGKSVGFATHVRKVLMIALYDAARSRTGMRAGARARCSRAVASVRVWCTCQNPACSRAAKERQRSQNANEGAQRPQVS